MSVVTSYAQSINKLLQKADESFKNLAYADAIMAYEEVIKKDKTLSFEQLVNLQLNLANAYYKVKDFQNAERVFGSVLADSPPLKGEDLKNYVKYAQVLSSNGKRNEAVAQWKKYKDLDEQDKRAENYLKLYANIDALTRNASSYQIDYLGINSAFADFSPTYYNEGLVFVSGRPKTTAIKRVFSWDNSSFLDLYLLDDIAKIAPENQSASVSTSKSISSADAKVPKNAKLGSDYYTPPTANDAATIAHTGSDLISGSQDNNEIPKIDTKNFSRKLNSKYHEGPCSFFEDGKKVIFTRNSLSGTGVFGGKKDDINRLHLYIADKSKNDWTNIKEFPFNSNDYSTGHPSINKEGTIMYFVSDMPGGYGGTDIFYSKYKDGSWSVPENLGGSVNTQGNEMFPFVDDAGNLYFSSDTHPGLGDLDIFFVEIDPTTLKVKGKIRNLGAPINSSRDDFGILTDSERKTGFFSSNRKRGGSDDDIYSFVRSGTMYGCRDLIVAIKNKQTKKPIPNVQFSFYKKDEENLRNESLHSDISGEIKLCLPAESEYYFEVNAKGFVPNKRFFSNADASDFEPTNIDILLEPEIPVEVKAPIKKESQPERVLVQKRGKSTINVFRGVIYAGNGDPMSGVKVRFVNKCNNQVQEKYTKKDGSYEFERDPECDYDLIALKDDFATSYELIEKSFEKKLFGKKVKVSSNASITGSLFDTKIYKVGDVVKLDNIYYNSDDYKLKEDALKDLDKLVQILNKYPNMIIEIYSHTDTRGSAADNLQLSQLRAREVEKYLIKNRISKARIKALGKGETEPVNNCGDGVQCTESEHKRNRRTEFKILSIERI